jgi:hypothetical protein
MLGDSLLLGLESLRVAFAHDHFDLEQISIIFGSFSRTVLMLVCSSSSVFSTVPLAMPYNFLFACFQCAVCLA